MSTAATTRRVTARPAAVPAVGRFAGTGALVRLAARRDRVLVPVWWAVFAFSAAGSAGATVGLYPTEASRVGIASTINANASFMALYGPVSDPTSLGQVSLFKLYAFGAALTGLLGLMLVVRHTRGEEEAGRTELVGSGAVGRWAPLAAGLLGVTGALVGLAAITAASLVGVGLDPLGSVSFGLAWLVTGLVMAGVGAVCAQLAATARGASGAAAAVLAVSYLVRAVADGSPDGDLVGLRWASPVGWAQEVHAFGDPRWAVGVLGVATAGALAVAAFALVDRRDLGSGLVAARAGAPQAPRTLAGPVGLAWRLQRGTVLGWALGFALLSMVIGGLVANVEGFLDERAQAMFEVLAGEGGPEAMVVAAEWGFLAAFVAAFAVGSVLRLAGEETSGHAEVLLAGPLARVRWALAHLAVALGAGAGLLAIAGVLGGLSTTRATGEDWTGTFLLSAAVQLPAVAVLAGIALLAVGLGARHAAALAWGAFVAFFLLGEVGPLLELPAWALDLSPFSHTPRVLGTTLDDAAPLGWLTLTAAVLVLAGLAALRRRDLR